MKKINLLNFVPISHYHLRWKKQLTRMNHHHRYRYWKRRLLLLTLPHQLRLPPPMRILHSQILQMRLPRRHHHPLPQQQLRHCQQLQPLLRKRLMRLQLLKPHLLQQQLMMSCHHYYHHYHYLRN
jgi:hypothetical protein